MIAETQYTDVQGTAAADLNGNGLIDLQKLFNLDEKIYKIVGIQVGGISKIYLNLLCEQNIDGRKHYVSITIDEQLDTNLFQSIFERFNVVLFDKFDKLYSNQSYTEQLFLSDIHEEDNN